MKMALYQSKIISSSSIKRNRSNQHRGGQRGGDISRRMPKSS